jgi:hypothetical protein
MSAIYAAVAVGTIAAGYMSSEATTSAAETAAGAQTEASQQAIALQREQFNKIQDLLKPYVEAGVTSTEQQQALLGLKGDEAKKAAIKSIEGGDIFKGLAAQGESAILQNASATGGLRGGNVQGALAQFRPKLLSDMIQQQFQNLGSMSNIGQAAATGVSAFGEKSASNISNLIGDIGAAQAGAAQAAGKAESGMWGDISGMGGMYLGSKLF